VVHVPDRPDVHVGLVAVELLLRHALLDSCSGPAGSSRAAFAPAMSGAHDQD
jgi:hypothetical protein